MMSQPNLKVTSIRSGICNNTETQLDVLLTIQPPEGKLNADRPAVNLGIVLDRSGSMSSQKKISYAREAAMFAVRQLLPTDRVSVTAFDDTVRVEVPSRLVSDPDAITDVIRGIDPGGSTALCDGWAVGASQVGEYRNPSSLNRVILLSDGQANVGEVNPDVISTAVKQKASEGVGTTTMGLGDDYNEDLLEVMAKSGDGNYYYIESPEQLPDIFQTELKGLMATLGNAVCLKLEPGVGVSIIDVLNDLDRTPDGQLQLSNLVAGSPVHVVVRLRVLPMMRERDIFQTATVCRFGLSWNTPGTQDRQSASVTLRLPTVSEAQWQSLPVDTVVEERAVLLQVARLKKAATTCLEKGDREQALAQMRLAKDILEKSGNTPDLQRESIAFARIEELLRDGDLARFHKHAKYQSHQRRQSKLY